MFKENKLIFWHKSPDSISEADKVDLGAGMIDSGKAQDIGEVRDINKRREDLRKKISSNDLLTEDDKQNWTKKLENVESNLSGEEIKKLQEEFVVEQSVIKRMVDTYTSKIMDSKDEAFAVDKTRDIDTAHDYLKWFETQSYNDKQTALKTLDTEIDERKNLRRKLLTRFDKKEVIKMRRSEMKDKLRELESVEANLSRYKTILKNDAKLFHNMDLYIEAFEDLTPQEQEDWMHRYEEEIAKPRRALVKTHNNLPKRFQSSNFFKMPSRKKQEYLETTETKIEKQYISQVNKIPTEIWADNSKKFAIDDFTRLDSIAKKAQWLEFLPSAIKSEEELAKKYKNPKFKDVKQMPDYSEKEWAQSKFEGKEKILQNMETEIALLDMFKSILDKSIKDKVISKKTSERYMDTYNNGKLNSRRIAVRSIMTALSPRRSLLADFEKLSPETQKKFGNFYNRGHKARLEIYKKAKIYEAENSISENSEQKTEQPKALEQNDVKEIVEKLQKQAEASEQLGNLEKALGLHEAVIAMHSENQLSKIKVDQLNMEINALETASDENVSHSNLEELRHIKLAEEILEDKEKVVLRSHGNEDLNKQNVHLGQDTFAKAIHEKLFKLSGGEKIIDSQGKAKKVQEIDLGKIGTTDNDTTQIKKDLENLSDKDNLDNIRLVNSDAGKNLTTNDAKRRLRERKERLARKVSNNKTFSLDNQLAT